MFPQPSFIAHILHAFLLLFAVVYILQHFRSLQALDPYRVSVLILLFSIVVGIHALSHLGLEKEYGNVWWMMWGRDKNEEFVNRFTCPCAQQGICPRRLSSGCPVPPPCRLMTVPSV